MADYPWASVKKPALRYTVKINGSDIGDVYGITSISITHAINAISKAELTIAGDYTSDFSVITADNEIFTTGSKILITAGYGDSAETVIFDGYITSNSISISGEQPISVSINCQHQAGKMAGAENAEYSDMTDQQIMQAILTKYSLAGTVETTTAQTEKDCVAKASSLDWKLLLSKAEANKFMIFMDGPQMVIGTPKFNTTPVVTIGTGKSVIDFKASFNQEQQPAKYKACIITESGDNTIIATATEPTLNLHSATTEKFFEGLGQPEKIVPVNNYLTESEVQSLIDSKLMRIRLSAFKGSVTLVGSPLLKTGCLVDLEGVGKTFSGKAFISSVSHSFSKGIWKSAIQFGMDGAFTSDKAKSQKPNPMKLNVMTSNTSDTDLPDSAISSVAPVIRGIRTAIVKKLYKDQESLYRIQIQYPVSGITVWARCASFYATNGYGVGFLPEINDEVIVGYMEEDARFPVILGSLYGTKNKHPNPPKDENNYVKSLTTKANLSLSFDDEKKVIIIKTPAGNTITISDDDKSIEILDQTKNSIKMSDAGIVLTSKKDLKLTATGDISIAATGKLTLDSKQDMKATSSMNISHTAQIGFTGKGTATAEVSATGQTTIKGAMVMIN